MRSCRRWSAPVVLLTLGMALSGCGSSSQSDPAAWVGTFCGGIGDVLRSASSLHGQSQDPEAQKASMLKFADSAAASMNSTADKLGELGPPKIPDGQKVHDTAVNFFSSSAKSIGNQRAELAKLDAAAPDFREKMGQLARPDLQEAGQQASALITNPNLAPAFRSSPQCQQLGALAHG